MKRKRSIFAKLVVLVFCVVGAVLLVVSVFIRGYIEQRETEQVQQKIQSIAKIVGKNPIVQEAVKNKQQHDDVVRFTDEITQITQVDFVVVMDTEFIRYSHPNHDIIGKQFSNIADAQKTLETGFHYSFEDGTLGAGVRYFEVITDNDGQVVGIICVGYRKVTVEQQIIQVQQRIFGAFVYGGVIAGILAYLFSAWIKRILLGLEPEELSQLLVESVAVSNHITEGVIALDSQRHVLFFNTNAQLILDRLSHMPILKKQQKIEQVLERLLFGNVFTDKNVEYNQRVVIETLELVVGRSPIYIQGKFIGAVVTFQDQTAFAQLVTELSQMERYNEVLRAANHHHMNQMHALNGLLELKQYDDAEKYIEHLKQEYHESIGYVSEKVKIPVITGFLLGKQQEINEKNMTLLLDDDSYIQHISDDSFVYDMLLVLGVLIDNAVEASVTSQTITVYLYTDTNNNRVICSVEDVGIGMSDEEQSHIFKRGYSTKGHHRGYGLDAVMSIVTERQGRVDVASQKGYGTCMTVEMAIVKEREDKNENISC